MKIFWLMSEKKVKSLEEFPDLKFFNQGAGIGVPSVGTDAEHRAVGERSQGRPSVSGSLWTMVLV